MFIHGRLLYLCRMGLEKAIEHYKEHRQHYRGAKRVSVSCRNNKGCPYCESNRMHSENVRKSQTNQSYRDWLELENTEFTYGHDVSSKSEDYYD